MVLLSTKSFIPAAPVWLIKNIWHIQVIQLSLMPVSRGSFQDPWGREVLASRIQRHPQMQLNRAAQQLAFLSRDFNKYLMMVKYLVQHTHTHTHSLAVLPGFAITIAIVWRKQRCVHISTYLGGAGEQAAEWGARCLLLKHKPVNLGSNIWTWFSRNWQQTFSVFTRINIKRCS